jgi:hypothetical protein
MAFNQDVILSAAKNLSGDGQMLRLWAQHDNSSNYVRQKPKPLKVRTAYAATTSTILKGQ